MEKEVYTLKEAAIVLGVSLPTLRLSIRKGTVPTVLLGDRKYCVPKAALGKMLENAGAVK